MKKKILATLFLCLTFILGTQTTTYATEQSYSVYDCSSKKNEVYTLDDWEEVTETLGSSSAIFDELPRQIVGECNLIQITDTTVTKHTRATVYINSVFPNGDSSNSSGIMIGKSTVLTAAHCVYNKEWGGYATKVTVIPARNLNFYPYGTATSTKIHIPENYKTSTVAGNDIAVVKLNSPIGEKSGYLACKVATVDELTNYYSIVEINGYPQGGWLTNEMLPGGELKVTVKGEMWGMGGAVVAVNGKTLKHWCDTIPGHSGSGLVYASNYVVGVHNQYPTKDSSYNLGCRIDSEYLKWINGLIS